MPEDLLPDFDLKIMPGRGVIYSPPDLVLHIHTNPVSRTNAIFGITITKLSAFALPKFRKV